MIACEGPSPPVTPEERVWCHPVATQFWDGVRGDSIQKKTTLTVLQLCYFLVGSFDNQKVQQS